VLVLSFVHFKLKRHFGKYLMWRRLRIGCLRYKIASCGLVPVFSELSLFVYTRLGRFAHRYTLSNL
jgi:hypothetical protein